MQRQRSSPSGCGRGIGPHQRWIRARAGHAGQLLANTGRMRRLFHAAHRDDVSKRTENLRRTFLRGRQPRGSTRYELGADIVKTNYIGDIESFRNVVNSVRVPIVVAGGPKADHVTEYLRLVYKSGQAEAPVVSIGRKSCPTHNYKQQHPAIPSM